MRRPLFWLPVLLLLALAAYVLPPVHLSLPAPPPSPAQPAPKTLPGELPPETLALFRKARPAVVRIDSLDSRTNSFGIGTGFFISATGQIMTAHHVVQTGQLFQVTTLKGQTMSARVKAFDSANDVALLQVEGQGPFPFLNVTPRGPQVGEDVLAIGNSGGDYLQPRRGTLLRLNAEAGEPSFPQGTLEMNAPLAPGDSGGPILNRAGDVVGVVSFIRVDQHNITQRSYAVPLTADSPLLGGLLSGISKDTPIIGLVFDTNHSGQTEPSGGVILRVAKGSPAARAGLRGCQADSSGQLTAIGDVILEVNGQRTSSADDVIRAVRQLRIGQQVNIRYLRGQEERQTTLALAARQSVPDLNAAIPSTGPCTTAP